MELQIRGVSKTYPNSVHALKDVTLTIPAGMYGLLGPNGAGKSTLMRMIATLQEPDAGPICASASVTVQGDALDFHSQGLAEVRLRHPRAADVRNRGDCVWDDLEECGSPRSSSGHHARDPVDACTHGYQGSSAAPQNRAPPNHTATRRASLNTSTRKKWNPVVEMQESLRFCERA